MLANLPFLSAVIWRIIDAKYEKNKDSDEEDDESETEYRIINNKMTVVEENNQVTAKKRKKENIVDVLRELVGLPVQRQDAHWFDLVSIFKRYIHVATNIILTPWKYGQYKGYYGCRIRWI